MMSRIKATFDRENTWSLAETHCFQIPGILNKIFHTFTWLEKHQPNSIFWFTLSVRSTQLFLVKMRINLQAPVRAPESRRITKSLAFVTTRLVDCEQRGTKLESFLKLSS